MTIMQFTIIILVFITPFVYQRLHFRFHRGFFEKLSFIRRKTGLDIHHGHWGLLYIFITSIWLIFFDKNIYVALLASLGWGLLLDEIIPVLKMPAKDRELELIIYKKSEKSTFILLVIVIILFSALFLLM